MRLDFFTPLSLALIRFSFLIAWLVHTDKANHATTSLKRTEYRGEAKGDLDVFFGKFKITASMMGDQLKFLNIQMLAIVLVLVLSVWFNVMKEVLR